MCSDEESVKEVTDSNTESTQNTEKKYITSDETSHSVEPSSDDDHSSLLSFQSSLHPKKDKKYRLFRIRKL